MRQGRYGATGLSTLAFFWIDQVGDLLTHFPRMTIAIIPPSKQTARSAPPQRVSPATTCGRRCSSRLGCPRLFATSSVSIGECGCRWVNCSLFLGWRCSRPNFIRSRTWLDLFFAIAALKFGWHIAVPWIEASSVYQSFTSSLDWSRRFFLARAIRLIGALLMIVTLIGSGIGRRELFLMVGNWRAPVQPEPFLRFRRPVPWTRFAVALLLIFGVVLPLFLYFTLHPEIGRGHRL